MASREFLKILSSARLGDVLAQQKLAQVYMTGAFKTPIQPSNALIWLEKSYFSIKNQGFEKNNSIESEVSGLLDQLANIPLVETFNTPAFAFGWGSFWDLAEKNVQDASSLAAKWQLANLLINPDYQETQSSLIDWLEKGCLHAIQKKYLKTMIFGIYLDKENPGTQTT